MLIGIAQPFQEFVVQSPVITLYHCVALSVQKREVKDLLRLDEVKPQTLEYYAASELWRPFDIGMPIPVHRGAVRCRALTKSGITMPFPLLHYVDMDARLSMYDSFIESGMDAAEAFDLVFESAPRDLGLIRLCHNIWTKTPHHIKTRFRNAGRSPDGTWTGFVHASEAAAVDPFASPVAGRRSLSLDDSPLANRPRQRPSWQGPPSSEAGPSHRATSADSD